MSSSSLPSKGPEEPRRLTSAVHLVSTVYLVSVVREPSRLRDHLGGSRGEHSAWWVRAWYARSWPTDKRRRLPPIPPGRLMPLGSVAIPLPWLRHRPDSRRQRGRRG